MNSRHILILFSLTAASNLLALSPPSPVAYTKSKHHWSDRVFVMATEKEGVEGFHPHCKLLSLNADGTLTTEWKIDGWYAWNRNVFLSWGDGARFLVRIEDPQDIRIRVGVDNRHTIGKEPAFTFYRDGEKIREFVGPELFDGIEEKIKDPKESLLFNFWPRWDEVVEPGFHALRHIPAYYERLEIADALDDPNIERIVFAYQTSKETLLLFDSETGEIFQTIDLTVPPKPRKIGPPAEPRLAPKAVDPFKCGHEPAGIDPFTESKDSQKWGSR